jgi:CRP-like cAMP-binding protein
MMWEHDHVAEALRRWPDVAFSLLGAMARRQHDLQRRVAALCNQRAPRRLARAVAALVEDRGVRHHDDAGNLLLLVPEMPSRLRLAGLAGMARETVSRLMTRWEQCGWIAEHGGDLVVRDPGALDRLAGTDG